MAWSYRRRIKIIPGVHLNFSKSGISTSIGGKGASMTFGKKGTYLNTSIPGLGIYNRQKISNKGSQIAQKFQVQSTEFADNIFSADLQEITSQDMQGIKEAIIAAHQQRIELNNDLLKIKASLASSKFKLTLSYVFIYGLLKKSIPKNIKADIVLKGDAVKQLQEQIENCYVQLDVEFDAEIKNKYNRLVEAFKKLATSNKIWDVTSAQHEDRRVTRSAASRVIKKIEVRFAIKSIPDIKTTFETLWFKNANGADLFFYPNFIVMYSSKLSFAIIGLDEIDFYYSPVRFVETGITPSDTKIIDKTWAKVNKNGTPDRRFKNNYQIPIVRYGSIILRTQTGLNEEYEFSNYEFTEEFGNAFMDFQNTIKTLKQL